MSPRSWFALCALAAPLTAQFTLDQTLPVDAAPHATTLVDLDADEDLDLIVAIGDADLLEVYTNDGDGNFSLSQPVLTGAGTEPDTPIATDLDGDGTPEVAVTLADADGLALYDVVSGTLTPTVTLPTGGVPRDVVAFDVDDDGDVDLVTADRQGGTLTVLENLAPGTFAASTVAAGAEPVGLTTGDFDDDGDVDLAAGDAFAGTVDIFANDGSGVFTLTSSLDLTGDLAPRDVASGDVDLKLRDDLVVAASEDGGPQVVTVLLQTAPGSFSPAADYDSGGRRPSSLALTDVDDDGDLDVLVTNAGTDTLGLLRATAEGVLADVEVVPVGDSPQHVVVGRVDANSSPDAIVCEEIDEDVSVLLNDEVGSPFTSLGFGLAGVDGIPIADGQGTLEGGSPVTVTLDGAAPDAPALFVVSLTNATEPFKGGSLVPALDTTATFVVGSDGGLALTGPFPTGVPADTSIYLQFAIADSAAVAGVALSNALRGVTP